MNPEQGRADQRGGAQAFADFILAPETQLSIGQFGVEKFGQPLFFPAATMTDEQLGV